MRQRRADAVLLDLLMAVMDSPAVWAAAAGSRESGLAWRDAVTRRMTATGAYRPYDDLVALGADDVGLGPGAVAQLKRRWGSMDPWPDSAALRALDVPYGFVTNSSSRLAAIAARRSGLDPVVVLSAEEAGWYKPHPDIYRAACVRIGAAPERTLFVAGAPYDAEGARDAGLQARFVRRRFDQDPPAGIRCIDSLRGSVDEVG